MPTKPSRTCGHSAIDLARMIADTPRPAPGIGTPDHTVLDAGAFRRGIVDFIERELPVWRDRPERPAWTDEPSLNQSLCTHLNSASRRQSLDSIQFITEPLQGAGRHADIGAMPCGTLMVENRVCYDFEQLLPIECKRLPTPPDRRRSPMEYVKGLPGHRTGGIERFKHALHGPDNAEAMLIAYVQGESFAHWHAAINARLTELASAAEDDGLWSGSDTLTVCMDHSAQRMQRLHSQHQRLAPPAVSAMVGITHLWMQMN